MAAVDSTDIDALVQRLYAHPDRRHAVPVESEEALGELRLALDGAVKRLHGSDAVWGRGIRIEIECNDDGQPHRAWLRRALVGGQRSMRDGFSSKPRKVRA